MRTRRDSDNPPLDATSVRSGRDLQKLLLNSVPVAAQERSCHWAISQLLPAAVSQLLPTATYQRLIEAAIGQYLCEDPERLRLSAIGRYLCEGQERFREAAIGHCPSCCPCEGQERLREAAIGQCLREDQERLR